MHHWEQKFLKFLALMEGPWISSQREQLLCLYSMHCDTVCCRAAKFVMITNHGRGRFCGVDCPPTFPFSALTLLVGRPEGHPASKKWNNLQKNKLIKQKQEVIIYNRV